MIMTSGWHVFDVDYLDEEFFGPPPKFLRESAPVSAEYRDGGEAETIHGWRFAVMLRMRMDAAREWLRRFNDA